MKLGNTEIKQVNIKRGQIHMVQFGEIDEMSGSLYRGFRPAIVVSNNKACEHSPVIAVIPLTTQRSKRRLPTHYTIQIDDCNRLKKESTALAEQIISVNRFQIEYQTGNLSECDMMAVDKRIMISMGIH